MAGIEDSIVTPIAMVGGLVGGMYVGYHTLSNLFGVNLFEKPDKISLKEGTGRTVTAVGTAFGGFAGFLLSVQVLQAIDPI